MDIKALEFRQNTKIITMFLIVQFLGILLATQVFQSVPSQQIVVVTVGQSVGYVLYFVVAVLIVTALIILLIRIKVNKFLLLFEAFAVFAGSFFVFLIFLGAATGSLQQILFGNTITYQYYLAALLGAVLIIAKNKIPRLRNTASIVASAGIGVVLGINFSFLTALLFMGIFAIYDFIAVFVTKHMVAMGEAMSSMNLSFLIGATDAEALPQRALTKDEVKRFQRFKTAFKDHPQVLKELNEQKLIPLISRRELGNGDIAFPLMVSVSAYSVAQNFVLPLVVVAGATLGLIITFFILSKYRRALPAIPPLLFGILIALAVYLVI